MGKILIVLIGFCLCVSASASSYPLGPFVRADAVDPVITPKPDSSFICPIRQTQTHWESLHTFNPAAAVFHDKIYVLYRAEDDTGKMKIGNHTSRLGLAESSDGLHFSRLPAPVFYPDNDSQKMREWPGGAEDPRLTCLDDGTFVLTYSQYNGHYVDIGIATSPDLRHWTKYGPAFSGKYAALHCKSAGIVSRPTDHGMIAAKIHGTYWMYWGEHTIRLATSPDAIHWSPFEDANHSPLNVLSPRSGHFDSDFPEVGPPPVLTPDGIIVLYNGRNLPQSGDASVGDYAYSAGQALFDADNPAHKLAQLDKPFFKPERPYEKTGQYAAGTTFIEGLVYFHHQWFLYYGCADSTIGVAVFKP
jgi:predicted GH43/DUF377 family glycosyl hydrolase